MRVTVIPNTPQGRAVPVLYHRQPFLVNEKGRFFPCGNDNWDDGKRAKNPTNVVYLFSPKDRRHNSFVGYGIALLEIECEDAEQSKMLGVLELILYLTRTGTHSDLF